VTLRIAAALALALGVAALLGFLHLLGSGPFASPGARHLRALKDRAEAPPATAPASLAWFDSLPYGRPLAEYEAIERRGVVIEGFIQHMLRAPDGDTHLEVTVAAGAPGSESHYVTAEITPQWYRGAPAWSFERLRQAFRPASGGGATWWSAPPRRVRLSGWLLNDYVFDPRLPGRTRLPMVQRASGWEVHPVTKIEVWDEHDSAFVEVPR
jgi:hypothetical protein